MEERHRDECQTRQLVTFEFFGQRYGVPKERVIAVTPLERGDLAASPRPRQVVVQIRCDGGRMKLAVDRLNEVITYEIEQLAAVQPRLGDPLGKFVSQVVDPGGKKPKIGLLDVARLSARDPRRELAPAVASDSVPPETQPSAPDPGSA